MKKLGLSVVILVLAFAAFLFYRTHKNQQQMELELRLIQNLFKPNENIPFEIKQYKDHSTTFWSDRSYNCDSTIYELESLSFIALPRNYKGQILGFCQNPTVIYCLANEKQYFNLEGWSYVKPILVYDSYEKRSMTALYKRQVTAGSFVLNYHDLRPSLPVFFNKKDIIFNSE